MRSSCFVVAIGLLTSGCETDGGMIGSVMGKVGGSMAGDVMQRTAGVVATSAPIGKATRELCGSDSWNVCHNATAVMLAGFTDEFIKRMSQEDVRQASDARDRSVRERTPQTWKNPESGASGTVESKPAESRPPKPTTVTVAQDQVETDKLPIMDAIGEPYQVTASKKVNVRGGPGTDYSVVDSLAPKAQITAIAKVRDAAWYMVGRSNIAIGYVLGDLIGPRDFETPTPAPTTAPAAPPAAVPSKEVQVPMASECYTTTQRVTLKDGTSEEAKVTSCRTPNGWAQV